MRKHIVRKHSTEEQLKFVFYYINTRHYNLWKDMTDDMDERNPRMINDCTAMICSRLFHLLLSCKNIQKSSHFAGINHKYVTTRRHGRHQLEIIISMLRHIVFILVLLDLQYVSYSLLSFVDRYGKNLQRYPK